MSGGALRVARQQAGFTQAQLAAATGLTQDALSRAELGRRALSVAQLAAVVRALQLDDAGAAALLRALGGAAETGPAGMP